MEHFGIYLAGLNVDITALYPETRTFCTEYLCEAAADCTVRIQPEDIFRERKAAEHEAAFSYTPSLVYPDTLLETIAVYRQIAEQLPAYGAWVFHGSAVVVDGQCYLFTAKSGTGKSTHTALWMRLFGQRAQMVNDDKPILRVENGAVTVYGTPWDGKHHLSANVAVPLTGLCILTRNTSNHIERISKKDAYPMLVQQSYRPQSTLAMIQTLTLLDKLAASTPLYRLGCNMDLDAARVAYEGMAH